MFSSVRSFTYLGCIDCELEHLLVKIGIDSDVKITEKKHFAYQDTTFHYKFQEFIYKNTKPSFALSGGWRRVNP